MNQEQKGLSSLTLKLWAEWPVFTHPSFVGRRTVSRVSSQLFTKRRHSKKN